MCLTTDIYVYEQQLMSNWHERVTQGNQLIMHVSQRVKTQAVILN